MNENSEPTDHFEAQLTLLPTEHGGRRVPIRTGYVPNWWIPTADGRDLVSAALELVDGEEMLPGQTGAVRVFPFAPEFWSHLEVGTGIEMTEGPHRTMGQATIKRVVRAALPTPRG